MLQNYRINMVNNFIDIGIIEVTVVGNYVKRNSLDIIIVNHYYYFCFEMHDLK